MNPESQQARQIMQYLLGELPEEEQSRLEERYFVDSAFFQEVRAARDDLIDAYLRGELPPPERARFETHFMASAHRRERIEFARALMSATSTQTPPPEAASPAEGTPVRGWRWLFAVWSPRWAAAAAAFVIVAIGAWFVINNINSRNQAEKHQAGQPALERQAQNTPVPGIERPDDSASPPVAKQTDLPDKQPDKPQTSRPRPEPKVATFVLTPELVRDAEETKVLVIPRNIDTVRLKLEIEKGDYRSYRAALRTPEGVEVWSEENIRTQPTKSDGTVVLRLPSRFLKSADYILRLSGVTTEKQVVNVGQYYFRAERK